MSSVEPELMMGVWGQNTQQGPGPWWGLVLKSLKLKAFCTFFYKRGSKGLDLNKTIYDQQCYGPGPGQTASASDDPPLLLVSGGQPWVRPYLDRPYYSSHS